MAIKTIIICDRCGKEFGDKKEMYYLFQNGADINHDSDQNVFCKECMVQIKKSIGIDTVENMVVEEHKTNVEETVIREYEEPEDRCNICGKPISQCDRG